MNLGPELPSSIVMNGMAADGGTSVDLVGNLSAIHALTLYVLRTLSGLGI